MIRKFIIGFLALVISTLNLLNVGLVEPAKANSVSTDLYATEGIDTTPPGMYPFPIDVEKLQSADGDQYQIKGRWNVILTEWDKLEFSNFLPKFDDYIQIEDVHLEGVWSRNNKPLLGAWITVFKPGEQATFPLAIPNLGIDDDTPGPATTFDLDLSSFFINPSDLNNVKIRFQAQSKHILPCLRSKTWHDQLKLTVKYNNQELDESSGYIVDAPDASYFPLTQDQDYDWSKNTDKVAASWGGFTGAEITYYKIALGDFPGGKNICGPINIGTVTQFEFNSSNCISPVWPWSLKNGKTYHFTLWAYTNKPGYAYEITSDGITIDTEAPSVSIVKPLPPDNRFNKTFDIEATANDGSGSGIAKVEFQLSDMSLTKWYDSEGNIYNNPFSFHTEYGELDKYSATFNSLNIPDQKYNLKVRATDNVGNDDGYDDITIFIDNTPPANPTLSVYATSSQAQLSWNSDLEVVSYNLFRDGKLIAEDMISISYIDKDVIPGETYHYRVTAKDDLGNESSGSEISVTIPTPGEIIASRASRLAAVLGETGTPIPEEEAAEAEEEGEILGTTVAKAKDDEDKEKTKAGNYTGWIYLLLLYILILLGYYYYYLKDEYTPWFWAFPLVVGAILLFINNSLTKVLNASSLAQLFWLWELIIFVIFCIYYQFFGRPLSEKDITKRFKIPTKK